MRRLLAACTLLTLAACDEPGDAACVTREESYRVVTTVGLPEPTKTADEIPVTSARVLATVFEESSIISCGGGLVGVATPGHSLMSDVPVYIDAAGFTLDVHATVYPEMGPGSQLTLSLLFDENGNGRCDDGEAMASGRIDRAPHSTLSLSLAPGRCLFRL
jgi:hypothetical protein